VSAAGGIDGFAGLAQGVGLDVVPFYSARLQSDSRTDDTSLLGKPGVDAFYHITTRACRRASRSTPTLPTRRSMTGAST